MVLGQVRATRAEYDDGRPLDSATEVPPSSLDALAAQAFPVPPTSKPAILEDAGPQRRPQPAQPDPAHHDVPQRNVSSRQAQWFVLSQVDSATVSTPDGRGVTFRRRDPQLFRSQLKTSAQLLGTAAREWPTLRRRYRDGGPAPDEPRGLEADLRGLSGKAGGIDGGDQVKPASRTLSRCSTPLAAFIAVNTRIAVSAVSRVGLRG